MRFNNGCGHGGGGSGVASRVEVEVVLPAVVLGGKVETPMSAGVKNQRPEVVRFLVAALLM
jgi:hypothetical protein